MLERRRIRRDDAQQEIRIAEQELRLQHPLPSPPRFGTLGLIHTLSCAAIYLCVGVLARTVLRARPTAARIVTRVSGVVMIIIGVLLLVERLL
ncbi:hypothetical protein ACQPW1_12305 [Nocardia sp. CA-128927]|uniref:hypothetical protein n=1 Tax=Nocardia sp. CA-128927 TaxID=3239975 RepID=UPI003D991279